MIGAGARRRSRPIALLLAVCLLLSGVVVWEWADWREDALTPAAPSVAATARAPEQSTSLPPLPTYAEVLSRPLFSPTRRPSDETAAPEVSTSLVLVAIVTSPRGPHALVTHGKPAQIARVVEGQEIDGWTVDAIKSDRLILRRGGSVLELVPVSTPSPARPATTPTGQPGAARQAS